MVLPSHPNRPEERSRPLEGPEQPNSAARFARAFHACPDPIVVTRREDGKILEANEAFDRIYGVPAAQVIGHTTVELGIWPEPQARERMLATVNKEGRVRDFETVIRVASGEDRIGLISAELVAIEGQPCLVSVFHDVTLQKSAEQSLRESEERYHSLASAAFEGIGISEAGNVVEVNDQMAHMLGYGREELIGCPVSRFVAPESMELVQQKIRAGEEGPYEHLAVRKDGTTFPVEVRARSFWAGKRQRRVTSIRDITARKQAEQSLRASEERFRGYFDMGLVGMVTTTQGKDLVQFNDRLCEILGYSRDELAGKSWAELTHPEDLAEDVAQFERVLRGEIDGYELDKRFIRKDGGVVHAHLSGKCLRQADGRVASMVAMVQDITARKRAEESLRQAQQQALVAHEQFAQRLISAQEQERKRLANELHDSLGQSLSLIKNRAFLALQQPGMPAAAADHVEAIARVATDAIAEVRNLAHNLRPVHIDQFGLTDSLASLADQTSESTPIRIVRHLENVDDLFQGEAAAILYRIVQEALNNIVKHSRAAVANVRVERDLHCVRVQVEDDGKGFDPGQVSAARSTRTGIGLTSIAERVRMLGGRLRLEAAPDRGTRIQIEVPLRQPAGGGAAGESESAAA